MTDLDQSRVLVLDSDTQAALSVVRTLGRRGLTVVAGGSSARSLGMLSWYSDDQYVHPDPDGNHRRFLDHLHRHVANHEYDAVLPVMDGTTTLVAKHKDDFASTDTPIGVEDWETFLRAYDKGILFESMADVDVPCPETVVPSSLEEALSAADDVDYPAVVKPRSKSVWVDGTHTLRLVSDDNYVESPAECRATYRSVVARNDYPEGRYPLIQEYVPGTTTTTVGLAADGRLLTYFQEKRLRTYPASGGNSALLGAVRSPRMRRYAERVLAELDWTGPVMVEFMEGPDGEYYLIEVNGRYWGSLPFALTCGVDVPWLHYRQLRGEDLERFPVAGRYRTDVVQRRLLYEDVKWLGEQLAAGNARALWPFLRDFATTRHTFVDTDDPLPTAGALAQTVVLGARTLLQRGRASLDRSPVQPAVRSLRSDE